MKGVNKMKKLHKQIINQLYHGEHLSKKELQIAKNIVHGLNINLNNKGGANVKQKILSSNSKGYKR